MTGTMLAKCIVERAHRMKCSTEYPKGGGSSPTYIVFRGRIMFLGHRLRDLLLYTA
jgi:hypothetical protein